MQNDLEFEVMVRYDFVVGFGWILENPGFVFFGFWLNMYMLDQAS